VTLQEQGIQRDYNADVSGEVVDSAVETTPLTPEAAQAELDEIFVDGFDGTAHKSFSRGRTDVVYGRDTEDAQFHVRVELLLGVANSRFDTPLLL
jgi:hypothetical protein